MSRLPWARGLKLYLREAIDRVYPSRLPWARGLKLEIFNRKLVAIEVAPPVGAWIETRLRITPWKKMKSRLPWARGLKLCCFNSVLSVNCRASRGRVD